MARAEPVPGAERIVGSLGFRFTNLPTGRRIFTVTASNEFGESPHSNQLFVMVGAAPSKPNTPRVVPPQKLAQLDQKLRVQDKHFAMFRQGIAPDYPRRMLAARELLDLPMTRKAATQ